MNGRPEQVPVGLGLSDSEILGSAQKVPVSRVVLSDLWHLLPLLAYRTIKLAEPPARIRSLTYD